ncbi:MAG: sulfurtransferase [Sphaerospermopsis sp. SIO1G1]|nr:sulfurtransferase [Sphaerospermopsis sp. SIO1G1]
MMNHQCSVTYQWLSENLHNSQVVIIDCRFSLAEPQLGFNQYKTSHIPGAYYLDLNQDLSSPVTEHGGRHPLPNIDNFAAKLTNMGVEFQKTLVVIYDDSRFAFASRLWWLLRYLGHDQVVVLDGGFTGWQNSGYPVDNIIPESKVGNFSPQLKPEKVVDYNYVKTYKDSPNVVLIDSRDGDRYRGEREPIDKIAGHIPGAVNYPWKEVSDSSGFLLPQSAQLQRWEKIAADPEIIVYCGSGVTACVNLLSLEIAGISQGKLYAGSWSDWISY